MAKSALARFLKVRVLRLQANEYIENIYMKSFLVRSITSTFLLYTTATRILRTTTAGMSISTSTTVGSAAMRSLGVRKAKVTHPTGDPKFSVMQPFPAAFAPEESDPFLMLDQFGPTVSTGIEQDPDSFPVAWHPHRGMDLLTYLTQGVGRHADSMGNRESFPAPGMQWISAGSGIEHAEGGGTPKGEVMHGFQIWVNVPSELKMNDPMYGTEPTENIPILENINGMIGDVKGRLLAGAVGQFQVRDYSTCTVYITTV